MAALSTHSLALGPWPLKVESLYVDLGSFDSSAAGRDVPSPTSVNHCLNVVRGGITTLTTSFPR